MNMEPMQYKGFLGSIEISKEDKVLYGKLLHINGLVTYEAESYSELEKAFREAVDDYLTDCEEKGISPQKTCSGSFNLRVSPEKHRQLVFLASASGKTLNALMNEATDLIIEKHTTENVKTLANTVFEFNWDNNQEFRSSLTQWMFEQNYTSTTTKIHKEQK